MLWKLLGRSWTYKEWSTWKWVSKRTAVMYGRLYVYIYVRKIVFIKIFWTNLHPTFICKRSRKRSSAPAILRLFALFRQPQKGHRLVKKSKASSYLHSAPCTQKARKGCVQVSLHPGFLEEKRLCSNKNRWRETSVLSIGLCSGFVRKSSGLSCYGGHT